MIHADASRPTLDPLLTKLVDMKGSDLYLTVGCAPSVRLSDRIVPIAPQPLDDADMERVIAELLDERQRQEFAVAMELNMALPWGKSSRFRVNLFRQQEHYGLVIRRIQTDIPTIEGLHLPKLYGEIIMEKRGLILVAGPTGSGKTTSLAAMIGYRNQNGYGHIVTVEDPIEFVHHHAQCIITQRDVGIDTASVAVALKNVLRQRPDVVLIGEIRDTTSMAQALHFSETGHLCVATLHAGSTCQVLEAILSFFPQEKHHQVRYDLSNNLRGILCQRLVLSTDDSRVVATEIMLNRGFIRSLIQENRIKEIPEIIAKNRVEGMQTLDQALLELYQAKVITEEVAMGESDNPANMRLLIRQAQAPAYTELSFNKTAHNSPYSQQGNKF